MMPGFLKIGGGERRAVHRALETLDRSHTPVRLELEKLGVRFKTTVSLRKGLVAIARPLGFKLDLPASTVVRFKLPERHGKEVRLEIANPNFQLPGGKSFFICPQPTRFADPTQRRSERYSTSRFRNLELHFPGLSSAYRIMDLSLTGCRIATRKENLAAVWAMGEPVQPVEVRVGNAIRIELESVIPRTLLAGSIGLEFNLGERPRSREYLTKLVKWLNRWEDKQTKVVEQ